MRTVRTLSWYDKDNDELAGEAELKGVDVRELKKLFGVAEADPMYETYQVGPEHLASVERWAHISLELDRYDYFIECTSVQDEPVLAPEKSTR